MVRHHLAIQSIAGISQFHWRKSATWPIVLFGTGLFRLTGLERKRLKNRSNKLVLNAGVYQSCFFTLMLVIGSNPPPDIQNTSLQLTYFVHLPINRTRLKSRSPCYCMGIRISTKTVYCLQNIYYFHWYWTHIYAEIPLRSDFSIFDVVGVAIAVLAFVRLIIGWRWEEKIGSQF